MNKMRRAYSVHNVLDATFRTLPFDGEWLAAVGRPEPTGSWMVYGPPKNGKTTFALMLAKYLSRFVRVAYDSVEEGLSLTIRLAMERVGMLDAGGSVVLLDREGVPELMERLSRRRSPDVVVVDSVQFLDLKFADYRRLKEAFPRKLFIYVSHVEGQQPEGNTARRIWRDANVAFKVQGFRAFPVGRYGGGQPLTIDHRLAAEYWGLDK